MGTSDDALQASGTWAAGLVARAAAEDPQIGLPAVAALRTVLAQLEAEQVDRARRRGWSWQEIANRLGVTKQTVHRKYAVQDAVLAALRARR
jgi:DNA invertase Pin-like site-specific DNA recombinase